MDFKNRTKHHLADALKRLLRNKDFQEVRVSDICAEVGCQRSTFYYHFEDKYDLAAWIYVNDIQTAYNTLDNITNFEKNVHAMEQLKKNQVFYKKTMSDESLSGMFKYNAMYFTDLYKQNFLKQAGQEIIDDDLMFSIRYITFAGLCLIREWLISNSTMTAEELTRQLFRNWPDSIKQYQESK